MRKTLWKIWLSTYKSLFRYISWLKFNLRNDQIFSQHCGMWGSRMEGWKWSLNYHAFPCHQSTCYWSPPAQGNTQLVVMSTENHIFCYPHCNCCLLSATHYFHFSITFSTSLIHHNARHCDHMWESPHLLTHDTRLCSIKPALVIWWTDDLWFTCYISFLSYLMCTLPQPSQSQVIVPCGQALVVVSPQMSLVTFLFIIHI